MYPVLKIHSHLAFLIFQTFLSEQEIPFDGHVVPAAAVTTVNRLVDSYLNPCFSLEEGVTFSELCYAYPFTTGHIQIFVNDIMAVIMENMNCRVTAIRLTDHPYTVFLETQP